MDNLDCAARAGKRRAKRKPPRELAVGRQGFTVLEECRFIPLRLNERERGLLAMLKGALNVSEYTDRRVLGQSFCSTKKYAVHACL